MVAPSNSRTSGGTGASTRRSGDSSGPRSAVVAAKRTRERSGPSGRAPTATTSPPRSAKATSASSVAGSSVVQAGSTIPA
ncbi:hypothetical protein ACQP2T_03245 [Nonomuraea sp. CA-143628]|uniref:hypothetical protein n=1 Tax=Nonomuraea sp. CA-143628 TaxID=3239997 RepID=UPI003D94A563